MKIIINRLLETQAPYRPRKRGNSNANIWVSFHVLDPSRSIRTCVRIKLRPYSDDPYVNRIRIIRPGFELNCFISSVKDQSCGAGTTVPASSPPGNMRTGPQPTTSSTTHKETIRAIKSVSFISPEIPRLLGVTPFSLTYEYYQRKGNEKRTHLFFRCRPDLGQCHFHPAARPDGPSGPRRSVRW